jgi:5-methylcytosine-specific restriction endonuclease McrA
MANAHPADKQFLDSRDWRDRIRPRQLRRFPLCATCEARGVLTLATEVDHIVVAKGDMRLLRSSDNLRSLCKACHSRKTRGQSRGYSNDVDLDGYPTDANHPANRVPRAGVE